MTIFRKNLNLYGTALEIAVWKDDAAKVGLLLDYGADPGAEVFLNDEDHEIESSCLHTERSGGNLSISVGGSDTQKAFGSSTPGEEIEHNTKTGSSRTDISRVEISCRLFYTHWACRPFRRRYSNLVESQPMSSYNLQVDVGQSGVLKSIGNRYLKANKLYRALWKQR